MALIPRAIDGRRLSTDITGAIGRGQQLRQGANVLEQQQQALQGQQLAVEQEQQAADLAAASARGENIETGEDIARLLTSRPELVERIRASADLRTERQLNDAADFGFQMERAAGDVDAQNQLIEQRIERVTARGGNPKDTVALRNATPERRAQAARTLQILALSNKERLDLSTGKFAGQKIQRAEFIEGEGFAGLTEGGQIIFRQLPAELRDRLRANKEQELLDKLEADEATQPGLSAALEKRLTASVDAAASAQSSANEFDALAIQFEQEQPSGGFLGGTALEALKTFTGSEDAVSLLRKKFAGIRASQAVKNLPPGAASDVDVALALSGFPAAGANATFIASWLRGVAKLEREGAQFEDFRSAFISAGGSPDRSKRAFEFDGFTINKGDRLTNAYRNFRLGKGDSAVVVKDDPKFGIITEEDIAETLRQNPGLTREQLLLQVQENR